MLQQRQAKGASYNKHNCFCQVERFPHHTLTKKNLPIGYINSD